MAKKKRKGGRRRSYKKKKAPKKRAKPAAAMAGAAYSGFEIFLDPAVYLTKMQVDNAKSALKTNLTNTDNYKPALLGLIVSSSKKVPGVKMLAKPIDQIIRDMSKGKWGL